ncbi:hypothetical protein EMMF5_001275 [Cystobasidiomycetes sp. EMM_F5]
MVIGWFRPPSQRHLTPNDLEVYNVKTDGWGLIALAGVLVSISSAVAWPREPLKLPADGDWGNSVSSTTADAEAEEPPAEISKRIGNAIVAVTIFHHVTTAFGAWDFYKRDSHYSTSMSIGVWANVFLTAVGTLSFFWGDSGYGRKRGRKGLKGARQ